jgi:CYTH domain-containing protein
MEIERERTFLLKYIPKDLKKCESVEMLDIYIPESAEHPVLRIRKRGDVSEITKKQPLVGNDSSEQSEHTISLTPEEYAELASLSGKRLHKRRYFYPVGEQTAEVDIYLDDLAGLGVADFEFDSREAMDKLAMPDFCLIDVTQEEMIAGGILAGKTYADLEKFLQGIGYEKITSD